MRLGKNSI
ncbi:hypothetical protein SPV_2556 [Streptococcus pneumoniae]|nr:hypothetical protein SPV_2556 [Streptococcus pneumoniae]